MEKVAEFEIVTKYDVSGDHRSRNAFRSELLLRLKMRGQDYKLVDQSTNQIHCGSSEELSRYALHQ